MQNEIRIGRKTLFAIEKDETNVEVLADCNVTGGMVRIKMSRNQFDRWQSPTRGLIQDIFPLLKQELREVLISGQTPAEWNEIFGQENYTKKQLIKEFNYEFES